MRRFLAAVSFLFLITSPAASLDLSDIRDLVRFYVQDEDTNNQRFSDDRLDDVINSGHRDAVVKTLLLEKTSSFVLVGGTTCYALPTDTIHIRRVTHKDKLMAQKSIANLDSTKGSQWELTTGDPQNYYIFRSTQICFYPAPVSTSTGTAKVYLSYQPNTLSSDSDEPFDGLDSAVIYHDSLVWYTVWQVLVAERRFDEAAGFAAMYLSMIEQARQTFNANPDYMPSFGGRQRP